SLRGVSQRTLSHFVTALRKEPGRVKGTTTNASTIKVRLQFLHTALSWAVRQKMIAEVPDFPTVAVAQKDPQPVPTESFEKLRDKARDPQLRAFVQCCWLAGMRLNEAYSLEWEQTDQAPYLDLARNRIIFPAAFVKAKKDQWVPLAPELRQAIE